MTDPTRDERQETAPVRQILEDGDLVGAARYLAESVHAHQVDRAGEPYIGHVSGVAGYVTEGGGTKEAVAVAWLHDTIEDTWVEEDYLVAVGFPANVVSAVVAISKEEGESDSSYASRVAASPLATEVKWSDLRSNRQVRRLALLSPETRRRLVAKYNRFEAALRRELSASLG